MNKDYTLALKFTGKTGGIVRTVKALSKTIEKDLTIATGKVETSAGRIKNEFHGAAKAVQPMVKSLNSAVSVSDRLTSNFNKIAAASKKAASIKAQAQTSAMLTGKLTDIVRARTIKPPPLPKRPSILPEASLPKPSILQRSAGLIGRMAGSAGRIAAGFSKASWVVGGGLISGLGKVAGTVFKIATSITSRIVGGFKLAFKWAGKIGKSLLHLPITGLKFLAAGGAAIYGAHKALGPAAEMERYKVQLDVMKKGNLYDFLTKASAGKPFQMGETVQAGVLMEAFKIPAKQFLGTVMDAAAGFKKPLEEVVRMLGYARSGRTGEALESSARIGITRSDLRKFGIRFEKSGQATADTADKLMTAMIALMKSRFGGMANRIGTTTYEGAVSDFKDSLFRAFAGAGEKFLPYATKIVRSVSAVVANIGKKLKTLPWATWGKQLADGVKAAGNVINNLMDPKRLGEIGESLSKAWEGIKPEIPKLGKALVLDLVNLVTTQLRPGFIEIMGVAFQASKGLIGSPIKDAFSTAWNTVWTGITFAGKWVTDKLFNGIGFVVKTLSSVFLDIVKKFASLVNKIPGINIDLKKFDDKKAEIKNRVDKNVAREKERIKYKDAKAYRSGLIKLDSEKALEKWDKELKDARKAANSSGNFKNTKAVLKRMEKIIDPKDANGKRTKDNLFRRATQTPEKEKIPLSLIKAGRDTGYIDGKAVALTAKELQHNAEVMKKIAEKPDKYRLADPKGDAIKKREAEAEKRRQAREKVNQNVEALLNPKSPAELLKQAIPEIFGRSQPRAERDVFGREIKEVTTEIKNGNSDQVDLLKRLERQLILLNKKLTDNTP